jgi:hypothetical protein
LSEANGRDEKLTTEKKPYSKEGLVVIAFMLISVPGPIKSEDTNSHQTD